MGFFDRDPGDWLRKFSPDEWLRAAMGELRQAEAAFGGNNVRGAIAGCKRAAGMALNGALILEPNDGWGRTYVEHIEGLAKQVEVPEAVRDACRTLLEARPPEGAIVQLRTRAGGEKVLEAAHDVVAHAYWVVKRHEG